MFLSAAIKSPPNGLTQAQFININEQVRALLPDWNPDRMTTDEHVGDLIQQDLINQTIAANQRVKTSQESDPLGLQPVANRIYILMAVGAIALYLLARGRRK